MENAEMDWDAWMSRLELGMLDIDAQHRNLVHTIRTFDVNAPVNRRKEVLMELMRYTREHFSAEEAAMASRKFPGLDSHREAHDRLLTELLEFTEQNMSQSGTMSIFHSFVQSWLFEHILCMDAIFAAHVRSTAAASNEGGKS